MTTELGISVIVNTTDRAAALQTLLSALEQQSYQNFEVIVVVGPTRDHTLDVLRPYAGRVQVLRCPRANLGQSRNIGLAAARGEIVAYIDDDAVPCHHWLAQLVGLFADPVVAGTGGMVYRVHPDHPAIQHRVGIASSLAEQVDVRASWGDQIVPPGEGRLWTGRMMGTNMAFRRQTLLAIGGFDEFFEWVYDDNDIAIRLAQAGQVVHPVYEAVVYHAPASSRNRKVGSAYGRWWIHTKASTYFGLKNGPPAGDSWQAIARRCAHLTHGHWLWYGERQRAGEISQAGLWRMRLSELRGAAHGVAAGLLKPRKLLSKRPAPTTNQTATFTPFLNETSAMQPTVDPVTGARPSIQMVEPPLRLCLLSRAYPPTHYDGVGRLTNLMARGLFALGHTVHVITEGPRNEVTFYDGAYVHRIPAPLTRYERYRMLPMLHNTLNYSHAVHEQVKRLVFNDGVQVVDSPVWQVDGLVTAESGLLPVVVRILTALRQVAALHKNHDDDARLIGELEQRLLTQAACLAPNTQATVKALKEVYQLDLASTPYEIVPYGIVPAAETEVRPFNLAQPPATLTVLYLGRLEKRKGILDLFAAIPQVLASVTNVRFVIAGSDNSLSDGFQARAGMDYPTWFAKQFPACMPYVQFLGGVSDEQLQRLYQTCDLFVAPSLYESFGLIYLEAMNYAKPVIGCRAGGIPEVVDDGVNGLLVEPEAAPALAAAIITLLQSPQKLYEMGLAGRQRLLAQFTHLQMARNFEKMYRMVIQKAQQGKNG